MTSVIIVKNVFNDYLEFSSVFDITSLEDKNDAQEFTATKPYGDTSTFIFSGTAHNSY